MAKVRIKYEVDEKELDALEKQLKRIREAGEKAGDGLEEMPAKTKPAVSALGDLKGAIAGLGITAAIGAAAVSFAKLTEEVNKNRKATALLTKETGIGLDIITAKISATSKVFGKEYNEVLQSANAVSKNLGITMTETMDGINDAMSRGLDVNGEYLETIKEYGPFMKQAGIDFRQFNVLIQKQLTDGVFSDKGIDAIKEAVISIQEMTPATADALKAVGLNTNQIIKDIEKGTKTYFDVIQEIGEKMQEITDPRVRGMVLADVFRGAGEDAGDFALTLNEVTRNFDELTPEAQKAKIATDNLLSSTTDLNEQLVIFSKNTTGIWTAFLTSLNEFGAGTLKLVNELLNANSELDKKTQSLRDSFASLTKAEASAELEKLNNEAEALQKTLDDGQKGEQRWFDRLFGPNNIERTKEQQKELDELNFQIGVLSGLLDEVEKKTPITVTPKTTDKPTVPKVGVPPELLSQTLNLQSEIGDQTKENEQKLQDDLTEIAKKGEEQRVEDAKQIQANEREQRIQDEITAAEQRNEAIEAGVDAILDIYNNFAQLRIQQIDQQIQANELARNRELELAEGNAQKQQEINDLYDRKNAELRKKQANEEKKAAIFSIAVNTARGVVAALASTNVPLSIIIGTLGAAQAAFVLAQPVPEFAEGTLMVKGRGTSTSDDVPAWLSVGEAVIPADRNRDYHPTLEAIYNRSIDPNILNEIAANGGSLPNITVNDYDKLADAVRSKPEIRTTMDANGFTQYLTRQSIKVRQKASKFSM